MNFFPRRRRSLPFLFLFPSSSFPFPSLPFLGARSARNRCTIGVRSAYDRRAIGVRSACDRRAIGVRSAYDRRAIGVRSAYKRRATTLARLDLYDFHTISDKVILREVGHRRRNLSDRSSLGRGSREPL